MKASSLDRSVRSLAGKTIHRYGMVQENDRILVAVSGGKDSLTAWWVLNERLRRVPITYELRPVYLDMGYNPEAGPRLDAYFRSRESFFHFESTDYAPRAHSPANRENPCFMCSRLRRRRLFELAVSLGCAKVALGHTQDDIIETLFLNLFYGASISTMKPCQSLFDGTLTLIRPLALVPETVVERFAKKQGFPLVENLCPSAKSSRRADIRRMLHQLYRSNRKIRGNIFHALQNVNTDYLL